METLNNRYIAVSYKLTAREGEQEAVIEETKEDEPFCFVSAVGMTLDEFEQRLMVSGLMDFRNDLLKDDKPTEDINDLILKVIDAPTKKEKRRAEREER